MDPTTAFLIKIIKKLGADDFSLFQWYLEKYEKIKESKVEGLSSFNQPKTVNLLVKHFPEDAVDVTRECLEDIDRKDLVRDLSQYNSGVKHFVDKHRVQLIQRVSCIGPILDRLLVERVLQQESYDEIRALPTPQEKMRALYSGRLKAGGAVKDIFYKILEKNQPMLIADLKEAQQDSNGWTKLEPEVNSTDADEAPIYSLHSKAGNFECSVSGFRWVCKDNVSFKYQFRSWEKHMERMKSIKYMPASSLMDINVTAGKLDEVYLPHWICIDDNPEIIKEFAVLHINESGDVVEKVSEVTSSHVKLHEPTFSPIAVLISWVQSYYRKIRCNVLIYYLPNTTYLMLHVYLIPHDHAVKQALDTKKRDKYKTIEKPPPDKYLEKEQRFQLKADIDTAEITPEDELTLRHQSSDPNFYEVYIEKPDRDFCLTLTKPPTEESPSSVPPPVWRCKIRKVDYQTHAHLEAAGPSAGASGVNSMVEDISNKSLAVGDPTEALILKTMKKLGTDEFSDFLWHLEKYEEIEESEVEGLNRPKTVNLLVRRFPQKALDVTRDILKQMQRNDLVELLSKDNAGAAGPSP